MKIHHLAIWTHDLDRLKRFYKTYFQAQAGAKYTNPRTGFESYFLSLDGDTRIEIMQMPGIPATQNDPLAQFTGMVHLAISTGSVEAVNELTRTLEQDLYTVANPARWTGDGYYESVVFDPDGNRVEITV
jgi:lactoylglutathione lyase